MHIAKTDEEKIAAYNKYLEKRRLATIRYRQRNKEKIRLQKKRYQMNNREYLRQKARERRRQLKIREAPILKIIKEELIISFDD